MLTGSGACFGLVSGAHAGGDGWLALIVVPWRQRLLQQRARAEDRLRGLQQD
jgi:hypothetical protein